MDVVQARVLLLSDLTDGVGIMSQTEIVQMALSLDLESSEASSVLPLLATVNALLKAVLMLEARVN